jgi:pentapeptide MXKDX repeat protein
MGAPDGSRNAIAVRRRLRIHLGTRDEDASTSERQPIMALRLRILVPAAGAVLSAVGLTSLAFAEDAAAPKPDAMSSDHMSSDHMGGMMKKPEMKHGAKHNKMKEGAMSSDHMAPSEPKQ